MERGIAVEYRYLISSKLRLDSATTIVSGPDFQFSGNARFSISRMKWFPSFIDFCWWKCFMVIHANTDGDLQSRVEVDFHITGFMNKKKIKFRISGIKLHATSVSLIYSGWSGRGLDVRLFTRFFYFYLIPGHLDDLMSSILLELQFYSRTEFWMSWGVAQIEIL